MLRKVIKRFSHIYPLCRPVHHQLSLLCTFLKTEQMPRRAITIPHMNRLLRPSHQPSRLSYQQMVASVIHVSPRFLSIINIYMYKKMEEINICLYRWFSFTSSHIKERSCIFARDIDFVSLCGFSIESWTCSDSDFFPLYFIPPTH